MNDRHSSIIDHLVEYLIAEGPEALGATFTKVFDIAMQIEREQFLGASHYERTESRRGYANGYKRKQIDTSAGRLTLHVPKTSDHGSEPFYPQALERGCRSTRAVMLAVAEMYIKGVSTRDVESIMKEFGIGSLSSSQVSRAAKLLDDELEAWRNRPLGVFKALFLDARYEKVRRGGVVQDAAVLSAIGIDEVGKRHILGTSVALSEAEIHWRSFLDNLVARGLRSVEYIVSDDHAGLRAAMKAVFGGSILWQRCQFHLAQNAIHHAPNHDIKKRIGSELHRIWNAETRQRALEVLKELVDAYEKTAPKLAGWLEHNIPEGLTVFDMPEQMRKRLRTANPIERSIQQEIKRRTQKIRVFPSESALLRLVSGVLIEIDEKWQTNSLPYISWRPKNG